MDKCSQIAAGLQLISGVLKKLVLPGFSVLLWMREFSELLILLFSLMSLMFVFYFEN